MKEIDRLAKALDKMRDNIKSYLDIIKKIEKEYKDMDNFLLNIDEELRLLHSKLDNKGL